jgi:hypothetical protein
MGAILRCVHCETVVVRLPRTPRAFRLDMRGARSVLVPGSRQVPANTAGLTTLIGLPAAKARICSKMSVNCVSYSSRVT